jgi:hypothetical protein
VPVDPRQNRLRLSRDALSSTRSSGSAAERKAAALALGACPDPRARELLAAAPDLSAAIERGELSWERLAEEL